MYAYFTQTTDVKIEKELYQCHIHNYVKGEKFSKHADTTYPTQIYNIGVCLNDDYEAGEFVLYNPYLVLPKKQGEIYTFESTRYHEVKEILNGERWSIICFLHKENVKHKIKNLV
jgi:predicted 2-oxoglutarate/Fe(II)-dependent dioxygenase YbiX